MGGVRGELEGGVSALQLVWALGLLACVAGIVERTRGDLLAPKDVRVKLRAFGLDWLSGDFARYAYHAAPEPTRSRLRRSAWAAVVFHLCWSVGATWIWVWLAPVGLVAATITTLRLMRPSH